MHLSTILVSTLALAVNAAPADPKLRLKDIPNPAEALDHLSTYFNLLAARVQAAKVMSVSPVCDLSKAQMPNAPVALPPVSEGLSLSHVAVGRGTQNYTCSGGDATAAPAAVGAVATLFNASCVAALYPDLLDVIPGMAVNFDLNDAEQLGASAMQVSGHHYFKNLTTPFFDLDAAGGPQLGTVPMAKANATDAPTASAAGVGGEKAVAWLKLSAIEGVTGDVKEVYRVTTAGGSPPATCEGMPEHFEVQYAAAYWFWSGEIVESDDE